MFSSERIMADMMIIIVQQYLLFLLFILFVTINLFYRS